MIYKLKYTNKETAIKDFLQKSIIDTDSNYLSGTIAIVEIGLIDGVDGYHYDLMTENTIDFGINEIIVNNPKHSFWGN